MQKKRLDLALVEAGLAQSRERAKALIMSGRVRVAGQMADKPGTPVASNDEILLIGEDIPYVSRGGLKLAAALDQIHMRADNLICMDVGASTGGFTDCLLQYGAARVYAVDVGYGQLAWKLRQDDRVIVIERTNIRHMPHAVIPEPLDLITVDASFISLKIIIPVIIPFLKPAGQILALIKPQFEVGKGEVGKGGVVRDPEKHQEVIDSLSVFFKQLGLWAGPVIQSPVPGPKGNREFMILLKNKNAA